MHLPILCFCLTIPSQNLKGHKLIFKMKETHGTPLLKQLFLIGWDSWVKCQGKCIEKKEVCTLLIIKARSRVLTVKSEGKLKKRIINNSVFRFTKLIAVQKKFFALSSIFK